MKRIVLTFVIMLSIGFTFAQSPVVKIGASITKAAKGVRHTDEYLRVVQIEALSKTVTTPVATATPTATAIKTSSVLHPQTAKSVTNHSGIQLPEASTVVREMCDSIGKGKKMGVSNLPAYYFSAKKPSNINSKESSAKTEIGNVH